ncbi:PREDICTED: probable aspartyl aminopeptidase isoform X2 [Nelumbo nucifera]|uniref:aspartyl aminopeptidase n=1 Tax=Nelumbo nucifera TaxID=4432 RepID=A0A1U7Z1P6_NELNU|nr:PREDICTED: probable aspartyl aminopeptidase isoform X2 [Nelumbo nucifera]
MTATMYRLQLLKPPPVVKSSILPKYSYSSFSTPTLHGKRLRKFSTVPHLCSKLDQLPESPSIVGDLLDYLNESWTQFHATAEAKRQLIDAGFHLLNENDEWDLKPGRRYFFTRNMSCLVAFAIGEKYNVGNGFHVIAAHTDSPCLKLKPKSASSKCGYLMVNVQTYGAGLWHTWFDRDLSLAGRAIVRSGDGSFEHKLVKVKKPILRVPTLAIHLDRTVNQDGFKPNLETHLVPLLATKLEETSTESKEKSSKASHHQLLMQVLSDELGCGTDEIASIELNVCDTQPSCLGGANNEFIFSGRLDNLASSYCALRALIDSCQSHGDLSSEHAVRMVALFDNEEVGSGSMQGAGAPTMFQAMRRITDCLAHEYVGEGAFERAIRQSFLGIRSKERYGMRIHNWPHTCFRCWNPYRRLWHCSAFHAQREGDMWKRRR